MSDTIACPDCGHRNPAGSEFCLECHFPLSEAAAPTGRDAPASGPARRRGSDAKSRPSDMPPIARRRPVRPRRPGQRDKMSTTLWLAMGAFVALLLVLIAVQANLERSQPAVEGSSAEQQQAADELRAALERDSTDTQARVHLADILFDTGNWSEAIIHYRAAIRRDSTLVPAIVDLGVCYYNLSAPDEAEQLFHLALAREPEHPFALFNLGIVSERRGNPQQALEYFHRVLQATPPDNMKPALMAAMERVAKATGRDAGPLDSTAR